MDKYYKHFQNDFNNFPIIKGRLIVLVQESQPHSGTDHVQIKLILLQ